MSDYTKQCEQRGLNHAQMREVIDALNDGLPIDKIDIFAWDKYDNMQMHEIRLALEHGLTEQQISAFLTPSMEWESMQHVRLQLEKENLIDEHAKSKLRAKRLKNIFVAILIVVLLGIAGTGIYFGKQYYDIKNQTLELDLTNEDITLQYGDPFNPVNYVSYYTIADNVELILPDPIDTTELGNTSVTYTIKNELKFETKELLIHIVDTTSPVINLSNQEVTLTRGEDTFSCKAYLSNAYDDVDGDLTDSVTCTDSDESKNQQDIVYTVSDESGNVGEKTLTLSYVDPEPDPTPETIIIYQNTGNDTSSSSNSSSSYNNSSSNSTSGNSGSSPSHGTKYFMFSSGYDLDTGYQACIAAGSSYGAYSCSPIQENGIYTGYLLTY